MKTFLIVCLLGSCSSVIAQSNQLETRNCTIPNILQGSWFSREVGLPTQTVIDAITMTRRGYCMDMLKHHGDEYSFVFKERSANCYHCVHTVIRTLNVFEKYEGPCEGMDGTFSGIVEYNCLGDWFVGKNHYFVVANTRESRKDEKYRCFLKNRDDDLNIGVSITPECNTLKTPKNLTEHLKLTPVKEPGCTLPQNFSGKLVNTANVDADVTNSETPANETYYPSKARYRHTSVDRIVVDIAGVA